MIEDASREAVGEGVVDEVVGSQVVKGVVSRVRLQCDFIG